MFLFLAKTSINPFEICALKEWNNLQAQQDTRKCYLCRIEGDHDKCGRLVPFDFCWIHVNCLIWSEEIYVDDYIVEQIHTLLTKTKKCKYCSKEGATIQCKYKSCEFCYHFNCALLNECVMNANERELYCRIHYENSEQFSLPTINPVNSLDTNNCYLVNIDGCRKKYQYLVFNVNSIYVLVGSMQMVSLGDIDSISDSEDALYPIDYCVKRVYWSTSEVGKKVVYTCKIRRPKVNNFFNKNCFTICHDVDDTALMMKDINEMQMLQTDGNSDYLIENNDSLVSNSEVNGNIDVSTVTSNSVEIAKTTAASANTNDNSFKCQYYPIKNQTLLKLFSSTSIVNASTSSGNNNNISNKPKILRLPNDYKPVGFKPQNNLQNLLQSNNTSSMRLDKSGIRREAIMQPLATTCAMARQQLNVDLTYKPPFDVNNLSPKSDQSDASLNLDFTNIINNPLSMQLTGDVDESQLQQQQKPQRENKVKTKAKRVLNHIKNLNFNYEDYHVDKTNSINNCNSNKLTSKTVITKCSKVKSQHTIKQLLDSIDKKVAESNENKMDLIEQQASSSLTTLLNSPKSDNLNDEKTTTSCNNADVKLTKNNKVRRNKRKFSEIQSEPCVVNNNDENNMKNEIETTKKSVLNEIKNILIDETKLNDSDIVFEISNEEGFTVTSTDINGKLFI